MLKIKKFKFDNRMSREFIQSNFPSPDSHNSGKEPIDYNFSEKSHHISSKFFEYSPEKVAEVKKPRYKSQLSLKYVSQNKLTKDHSMLSGKQSNSRTLRIK
jgi:hypothetical protein